MGVTCVKFSSSRVQKKWMKLILITFYLTQHIKISFQHVINANIMEIFIYLVLSLQSRHLALPHSSVWTGHTCSAQWPHAPNAFRTGQHGSGTEDRQITWACKLNLRRQRVCRAGWGRRHMGEVKPGPQGQLPLSSC